MTDIPNTRLINLVDTPANIQYSKFGEGQVESLPEGGVLDIREYRQVSVEVGATKASKCELFMGKISDMTLSTRYEVPLDHKIHTFEVVGPEMTLFLMGGMPESSEEVQLWIYLRA